MIDIFLYLILYLNFVVRKSVLPFPGINLVLIFYPILFRSQHRFGHRRWSASSYTRPNPSCKPEKRKYIQDMLLGLHIQVLLRAIKLNVLWIMSGNLRKFTHTHAEKCVHIRILSAWRLLFEQIYAIIYRKLDVKLPSFNLCKSMLTVSLVFRTKVT